MTGLVSVAVVAAYFAMPMSAQRTAGGWLTLVLGLVVVTVLLVWHLRSIIVSPYPRVRAVAAVATTIPLFLVVFAAAHYLLGANEPGSFSERLSRLDALYYSVTVFATVGFGDIVPTSPAARALTTVQMAGDLVILGLVAQVIVGAMRQGLRRRAAESEVE
jgi:voltage-gated potassium channel